MQTRPANLPRATAASLAVIAAAFVAVGSGLGSPERLVASGLDDALGRDTLAVAGPDARPSGMAQIAGSEEFWLSQAQPLAGTHPAAWTRPLSTGDRITLGARGRERTLEIVGIERAGEAAAPGAPPRLLLVTCRDIDDAAAPLVRLWLENEGLLVPGDGVARAL